MKNPMTLEVNCRWCGKTFNLVVEQEDFEKYRSGSSYIQDIFPYLTVDERELLISGTCGECWDKMFKAED